jgi:hypothetical protein
VMSAGSMGSRRRSITGWRDKLIEGGMAALAGKQERQAERELTKRVRELERRSERPGRMVSDY